MIYYRTELQRPRGMEMKDTGHREAVEAALRFEKTDRTPVNNFALVTAARSNGILVKMRDTIRRYRPASPWTMP